MQNNSNINSHEKKNVLFCLKSFLKPNLDGGFNPFQKYARQIGSFPQITTN